MRIYLDPALNLLLTCNLEEMSNSRQDLTFVLAARLKCFVHVLVLLLQCFNFELHQNVIEQKLRTKLDGGWCSLLRRFFSCACSHDQFNFDIGTLNLFDLYFLFSSFVARV